MIIFCWRSKIEHPIGYCILTAKLVETSAKLSSTHTRRIHFDSKLVHLNEVLSFKNSLTWLLVRVYADSRDHILYNSHLHRHSMDSLSTDWPSNIIEWHSTEFQFDSISTRLHTQTYWFSPSTSLVDGKFFISFDLCIHWLLFTYRQFVLESSLHPIGIRKIKEKRRNEWN